MMGWLHPWGRDRLGSAGVAEELPSRSGVPEPPGWNVDGPSSKLSPWSARLWLLVCQPFPLGIPRARAPAAERPQGFPLS